MSFMPAESTERAEPTELAEPMMKAVPVTPPPFGRTVPGNRWDLVDVVESPARTVTVIVVHFDQQRELDRTLAALARHTLAPGLVEVIVVDDGSPVPPVVPEGVTLLVQEDQGFRAGAARNLGAAHASGDILCFLDADTAPEPHYLERMARLPSLLPETVVAGHRLHADFGDTPVSTPVEQSGPAREVPEPAWLRDEYRRTRNLLDADDRSYRHIIGAVFACTAWFFAETGGFDEGFSNYGGEDWEWAHRAWLAGAIFAHEPDAVAWHDGADWAGRDDNDRRRRDAENAEAMLLSGVIAVDGSRPRALLPAVPDVVVVLRAAASAAAAFVCVDSVLAVLPQARVVVPVEVSSVFASDPRVIAQGEAPTARLRLELDECVRVELGRPGDLAEEAEAAERTGSSSRALSVVDALREASTPGILAVHLGSTVRVISERSARRIERWGADAHVRDLQVEARGIHPIAADVRVAGYLGGWS
jgi:GT2 family glycosyltransferase